jgi:hypothetical protein
VGDGTYLVLHTQNLQFAENLKRRHGIREIGGNNFNVLWIYTRRSSATAGFIIDVGGGGGGGGGGQASIGIIIRCGTAAVLGRWSNRLHRNTLFVVKLIAYVFQTGIIP